VSPTPTATSADSSSASTQASRLPEPTGSIRLAASCRRAGRVAQPDARTPVPADHRPLTPQGRQEFDADSIAYAELTKAVVML
jgi:hypothetical protein